MDFTLRIDGDLGEMMLAEVRAGKAAVSSAMRAASGNLKSGWRAQVDGAGLGVKVARTIRSEVFPSRKNSLNAATMAWSRAPEIIHANETGPLIRREQGFYLAIALPAAGKGPRGKHITPGEWERRTGKVLKFVFLEGAAHALLVDVGNLRQTNYMTRDGFHRVRRRPRTKKPTPMFVLVRQVKMQKRLHVAQLADAVAASLPGLIAANWGNDGEQG
jgi:hypothetical protein